MSNIYLDKLIFIRKVSRYGVAVVKRLLNSYSYMSYVIEYSHLQVVINQYNKKRCRK